MSRFGMSTGESRTGGTMKKGALKIDSLTKLISGTGFMALGSGIATQVPGAIRDVLLHNESAQILGGAMENFGSPMAMAAGALMAVGIGAGLIKSSLKREGPRQEMSGTNFSI